VKLRTVSSSSTVRRYYSNYYIAVKSIDCMKEGPYLTPNTMTTTNACTLDFPVATKYSAVQSRKCRQQVGKKLAHQRLLSAGQVDRYKVDGTNVVYRRPSTSYVSCAFLDEHDTVVAIDSRGYSDIIRLPPYDGGSKTPRRALGNLLTSQLSVAPHHQVSSHSHFHIRSIRNGNAFVVGNELGGFRVVATEQAARFLPKALLGTKSLSLGHLSQSDMGCLEMNWHGWQIPGPLRKYFRHNQWTLAQQLRNPSNLSPLIEISNWQDSAISATTPKTLWDFWETPSSLLAAHIGNPNDNFSIRFLDERVSTQSDQICVDLMGESQDIQMLSSLCFVSENCVACAAVEHQSKGTQSVIKLFDIRMVRNGESSSASLLPSFPRSSAHGLRASETFGVFYDNHAFVSVSCQNEQTVGREPGPCIWDLNRLHTGSLMITTKLGGHFLFDIAKQTLVKVKAENNLLPYPPIYALDKQYGTIAEYEPQQASAQSIALYKSSEHFSSRNRHCGYKRKMSSSNTSCCSKIETNIQDCYGLQTELSCMAFNESGTSIVGVSKDGDIFTWRT